MEVVVKILRIEVDKYPELSRAFQQLAKNRQSEIIREEGEFYLYRPQDNLISKFIPLLKVYDIGYRAAIIE